MKVVQRDTTISPAARGHVAKQNTDIDRYGLGAVPHAHTLRRAHTLGARAERDGPRAYYFHSLTERVIAGVLADRLCRSRSSHADM